MIHDSKYIVREVSPFWKPTEAARSLKQADQIARTMLSCGVQFAVVCDKYDEIIREYHAETCKGAQTNVKS